MAKYIIKRIAMGILSIFIVATLTFFLMNLVPGGPFVAEKSISKAAQEALAAKYGLDKPLFQQYLTYMGDFLKGDMGLSLRQRGRTVSDIIFSKFPVSAGLAGIAVAVALLIGIPLGCLSAYNRGKFADNFIIVLATCGIASGARPVLSALSDAVQEKGLSEKISVTQTGCIGLCQYEPIVEVIEPGKEKVTYVKMNPEKALEVFRLHLEGGQVVTKYTLSAEEKMRK